MGRPRGRVVGGPQWFAWQFVLLAVIHATGSEGLSSLDIATSGSLSTLTPTEEGKCGEDDVSETHYTHGDDESDNEILVLATTTTTLAEVDVTLRVVARSAIGPAWDALLELLGGLVCTVDPTTFGTLFESVGDVIRDL